MSGLSRKVKLTIASGFSVLALAACSTDTYVSQENVDKYDHRVSKFLIAECLSPQREIKIAVAEHFDFDRYELKQEDSAALDQFVRDIRKLKGRISIAAHTDYQGSETYNEQLSLRRANSVKEYLLKNLPNNEYQWELKHFGEKVPLFKEKTLEANAANRRAYVMFEQMLETETHASCLPPKPKRKVFVALTSHFEFDDATLREEDKQELDTIALKLEELQGHILIAGHTDYQGSVSYNKKLALNRAEAVKAYLETKVANTDSFIWEVKSFGESEPLVHEKSLVANKKNRRVFVVFREETVQQSKK
ncbi:OmpA family protein [Vibrio plantisponsor]|uniref:OmpA family protein n=1 Tax=Vibrio plantisponsor TaxID=664643 RepID=A0ABU4IM85_9VIBR|nr:OmpA family protein [Vibrio plantisponsor]MDW6019204.1 OmpA family protein [Vibrio plantisponsor]NNM41925.1 OmpA family protein [Vibrio plantisponsor]